MTQFLSLGDGESTRDLAAQLLDVVARLSRADDVTPTEIVVDFAAQAMPHAHHSGLTLIRPNQRPTTIASSDQLPNEVDALQYKLGEGPCLEAATGPAVLRSDDISTDDRWPRFGPRCAATLGVRSMLSLKLPVGGGDFAGINYYSTEVAAFTDDDVTVASVIVPVGALAVEAELRHHDQANLRRALDSSRHISTAVGIVMATHRVSSDEAFALLRRTSMNLNQKLADVAEEVNHTGALPAQAAPGRPSTHGARSVR